MNEKVKTFTAANFEAEVLKAEGPVLVDFWAEWCGPCRMLGPTIDTIAAEYEGKAVVGKLNVDHDGDISMKYGIMSIPTVIVFKGGQVAEKTVGVVNKSVLAGMLDKHL